MKIIEKQRASLFFPRFFLKTETVIGASQCIGEWGFTDQNHARSRPGKNRIRNSDAAIQGCSNEF
jgi:hypothetical protein